MIGYQSVPLSLSTADESVPVFARVVAGIDFSPASLAAIRWATSHIARHSDAIISYVAPPPGGFWEDDRLDRTELRTLRQTTPAVYGGLGGFAATLNVASVRSVVRIGRASHWLSTLVAESGASLLVLGRRVDSNRRGIGEPNVLERSARRTQASVLVVPEGTSARPRHVIAAIDQSDIAHRVLSAAHSQALLHSCPLIVLHVVPPTTGVYSRVIQSTRTRETRALSLVHDEISSATEHAERWLAELLEGRHHAVSQRMAVASGDPSREIVAVASQFEDPVIVIGKRGHDETPQGSIGSVARELLTRAPFSVLAIA